MNMEVFMAEQVSFPTILPETRITRAEAKKLIDGLREEAADLPEMTLEEINAEIRAARAE